MRILFISRAFPPVIGGIEKQNYDLSVWLPKYTETITLANRRGRVFLPLFAPYAVLYALFHYRSYDVILLGDGVLSCVGWIVKKMTHKPIATVLHGLDINYHSASLGVWYEKALVELYRAFWLKVFLPALDRYIAVSESTKAIAVSHGLPTERIAVIPNGVVTEDFQKTFARVDLESFLGMPLDKRYVLLTSGRLAKRKGVAWFIQNVFPPLPHDVLYVIVGAGPDEGNIRKAIQETSETDRVRLLGRVSDETRDMLFHTADIFVQPNIRIEGDAEGFGISVTEAGASGLPVVASALEGLTEAIRHGENGLLVEPEDARTFADAISSLLRDQEKRQALGKRAREYNDREYHWRSIARRYSDTLNILS